MSNSSSNPAIRATHESQHESVAALIADSTLNVQQKINLLKTWERDVRQLQVASGEGLEATDASRPRGNDRLQEILQALRDLGAESDADHSQTDVSGSPAG